MPTLRGSGGMLSQEILKIRLNLGAFLVIYHPLMFL